MGMMRTYPVLLMLLMLLVLPEKGDTAEQEWQVLETRYTRILFVRGEDLLAFHRAVIFGPAAWNRSVADPDADLEQILAQKIDAVFERAQVILDMRGRFKKTAIRLHGDEAALHAAHEAIYKRPCRVRAWYRYKTNTVHVNVRDVHAGMVAHELAHAIIDHYLVVKPPARTAEILARYVDSHL